MKKKYGVFFALAFVVAAGGCGTAASPILKTITVASSGEEKDYSIIYDNGKANRTEVFSPDNAIFFYADEGDYVATVENGKVTVALADTKLTDMEGADREPDDVIRSLMQSVADNAEHDIFDVTFIIDGSRYFVFEKQNVSLQTPCVLFEYDVENGSLDELYRWEDTELEGIAVDNATIIGGADGPTSIFLASDVISTEHREVIDESACAPVIDRVLNEYEFEPITWDEANKRKDDDCLIKMAEDDTGRYEVWGVISREFGSYGMILNDTIDGSDTNTNYVYKPWCYVDKDEDKPELIWNDGKLTFVYPEADGDGYKNKSLHIDCGYDTGHMEFEDE